MSEPVQLSAVVRTFDRTPVVRGLDLEVRAGELLALLGPSGCGKTTTLRLVAGLERPDAGTVAIGGDVVAGPSVWVPPERRRLGMVFQAYAVWPHRTVRENVRYPLDLAHAPDADRRVDAVLERVRLGALADRFPQQLSGGQQQRVALARALVARPRVLLLDEPLSALDAGLRDELRAEIRRLAREDGLTVILVTHDQDEALSIADRIGVLNDGRLAQLDTPEAVYRRPTSRFVAGFVGVLNVLAATRRGGVLDGLGLALPGPDGPVTVGFRPEDAVLGDEGVPVVPEASSYRGAFVRHEVRIAGALVKVDVAGAGGPRLRLRAGFELPA